MAEDYAIYRLYIDGVPFEFHSPDSATKTYADLCDVVAKAHADRKTRHFSFSTSSHPTKGRSIDVLVTASTRVMLDAPLGLVTCNADRLRRARVRRSSEAI